MLADKIDILEKLDSEDKEKIDYFINLILSKEKYNKLKLEINERRADIKNNNILSHDEIWQKLDVWVNIFKKCIKRLEKIFKS